MKTKFLGKKTIYSFELDGKKFETDNGVDFFEKVTRCKPTEEEQKKLEITYDFYV